MVTISLLVLYLLLSVPAHAVETTGNISSCIEENDGIIIYISIGCSTINDLFWSCMTWNLFNRKLRQLIDSASMFAVKNSDLNSRYSKILVKQTVLVWIAVISTWILSSMIVLSSSVLVIDGCVNAICIYLSFNFSDESYHKCCFQCKKCFGYYTFCCFFNCNLIKAKQAMNYDYQKQKQIELQAQSPTETPTNSSGLRSKQSLTSQTVSQAAGSLLPYLVLEHTLPNNQTHLKAVRTASV